MPAEYNQNQLNQSFPEIYRQSNNNWKFKEYIDLNFLIENDYFYYHHYRKAGEASFRDKNLCTGGMPSQHCVDNANRGIERSALQRQQR